MKKLDLALRIFLTILGIILLCLFILKDRQDQRPATGSLEPVVGEWRSDIRGAGIDPDSCLAGLRSIEFADLPAGKAGASRSFDHSVRISRDLQQEGGCTVRAALYHELGHAVFGLEHGSCQIMSTAQVSEEEYRMNWVSMVDEYLEACKQAKR